MYYTKDDLIGIIKEVDWTKKEKVYPFSATKNLESFRTMAYRARAYLGLEEEISIRRAKGVVIIGPSNRQVIVNHPDGTTTFESMKIPEQDQALIEEINNIDKFIRENLFDETEQDKEKYRDEAIRMFKLRRSKRGKDGSL